jgi:hypothetical protein
VTLRTEEGQFKNYFAVACITLDTTSVRKAKQDKEEEGFYSSSLNVYQFLPEEAKIKYFAVESDKKLSITCISSFMGRLIATMRCTEVPLPPEIYFFMYKYDENKKKLEPQPIPNGVQNLATAISIDGDHIIVGDAFRNITVLKKTDEEENKKEKDLNAFNVRKVLSNKIEAHVVGAFSLNRQLSLNDDDTYGRSTKPQSLHSQVKQLSEVEKRLFSIISVSLDGYIRLFKMKEKKNMQICAQINIQDKAFKAIALQLNAQDPQQPCRFTDRLFAVITQRSGIMLTSVCPEIEFRA